MPVWQNDPYPSYDETPVVINFIILPSLATQEQIEAVF